MLEYAGQHMQSLPCTSATLGISSSDSAPPGMAPALSATEHVVDPRPPQPTRMVTRSMYNIHERKRFYLATKHPIGVHQALKDPHLLHAMSEEFTALVRHGTWKLVLANSRQNLVGSKWVFCNKPYDLIDCYKVRLVTKGFHQRPGLDYT